MKKRYYFTVNSFEYSDSEAFGKAWEQAKIKATELHAPIYRRICKSEEERWEVYARGEIFLKATPENINRAKIF